MSTGRPRSVPSYRRHRCSGQGIVTLTDECGGRRDVLLGEFGTRESRLRYANVIAEWETAGRHLPMNDATASDITINELLVRFLAYAQRHYRRADGSETNEVTEYRYTFRPLAAAYGMEPVREFTPLRLKAVRQRMIELDWCRGVCNARTARIVRCFRWAVAEGLCPVAVVHALACVKGLQRGRCEARETEPIRPVNEAFVDALKPHVTRHVWGLIQLQRFTGCRPGEATAMRGCDLDTTGQLWVYRLTQHKTLYRGRERVIMLGPRAIEVVKEFLTTDTQAHLFSPRMAMEELHVKMRKDRKTRVQPSQQGRQRRKHRPRKMPGECYTVSSFARAIAVACAKAGIPHWHPNQLRHLHATKTRKTFGLEAAGAALGHSRMSATQVYAERDESLAAQVAAKIG